MPRKCCAALDIQEFTNLLRIFRISSLRPASGYLTPIGGDEPKANCNSLDGNKGGVR
jgi:hypothetical protein